MTPIIEVKGLSKKYRIGENQPYITLRDTLAEVIKNPFGKIKEGLRKDEFWALKDINFTVEPGEVVGIIGRNGAGKSTLLKILSRITPPTEGEVIMRGRVGSLLEVGTGFQQELTGRENIFLNGAILGMTQREIKRKFDEIVDFAEVKKFIDTPVKHYSSGMYMRLAFSIAAHLDPEILIVDEVLAVGDAEFQKKCLGKMDEVSKKQGRTVLFVNHNLSAIKEICNKYLIIDRGRLNYSGNEFSFCEKYYFGNQKNSNSIERPEKDKKGKKVFIRSIVVEQDKNDEKITIVSLNFEVLKRGVGYNIALEISHPILGSISTMSIYDSEYAKWKKHIWEKGAYAIKISFDSSIYKTGQYYINAYSTVPYFELLDSIVDKLSLNIVKLDIFVAIENDRKGVIIPRSQWNIVNT